MNSLAQDCFVLVDRLRRHSVEHAKEIALQYFYRVAYKELDAKAGPRKRLLGQQDVQVMMSPRISAQDILEFLEVPIVSGVPFAGVAWRHILPLSCSGLLLLRCGSLDSTSIQ